MRASAEVFDHVAHNGLHALDGPGQTALALLLAVSLAVPAAAAELKAENDLTI